MCCAALVCTEVRPLHRELPSAGLLMLAIEGAVAEASEGVKWVKLLVLQNEQTEGYGLELCMAQASPIEK